jgi:sulfonate transport system substrate-binding protein
MSKSNNRQPFLKGVVGFLLAAVLLIVAVGCTNNASSTTSKKTNKSQSTTIRIGYIGSTKDNIPTGAEGWGYQHQLLQEKLKKIGIEKFEFHAFPNGPPLNEAIAAGELDIGILGDTPAIVGRSNGLKTRLINQAAINNNVWLITPKNGVKTIEELKGKTVATQLGSYMYRYLIGVLKEKGLEKDVKVVNMLSSDAEAALGRNDIAAYAFPTNSGPLIKSKGYPVIDEAKDHPELLGSSVTVVTEDYLAKNPDFLSIWNDVRQQSLVDLLTQPEDFYQFQSEQIGFPVEVMKDSLPLSNIKSEALSEEGIKLLEGTKTFLVEGEFAKKDFDLNDWIAK